METILYAILKNDITLSNLVNGNITTLPPTPDSDIPVVMYFRQESEATLAYSGPVSLTKYVAQIEYWSLLASLTTQIGARLKTLLHGYRNVNDGVSGIWQTLDQSVESERGFHGMQQYTIYLQ